jgi:cell division protein FtsQ
MSAEPAAPVVQDRTDIARLWDNPRALVRIADLLAVGGLVAAVATGVTWLTRQPAFALRAVQVDAPLAHVAPDEIVGVIQRELAGNFFTLDLPRLRTGLESLPWVRRAELRREWPDRLRVSFEEHVPLARQGGHGLVNTHGEVFEATLADAAALPLFNGPEGMAKEMAIQYEFFQRALARIQRSAREVIVSDRRAWQLKLDDGLVVELGREKLEPRLERFVATYDRTVARLSRRPDTVDLRYSNGFAARVSGLPAAKPEPAASPRAGARRTG